MSDIRKQLWENQFWETVAFLGKAAFLFLLTPLMLQVWGKAGYGAFAVASSAVVFASMFDLGLRGQTRVELCRALSRHEPDEAGRIMARGVGQFVFIAGLLLLVVGGCSLFGIWSRLLRLPAGHEHLIITTVLCTQIFMFTGFFLEPLVAEGRIGLAKLATAAGSIAAIPAVWIVLRQHGSVTCAVAAWLGCLALANLAVPLLTGHLRQALHWQWLAAWRERSAATLFAGVWFNIMNVAWLAKNHGLTFLVAALSGPVTAGTFYILLRLSEIIGSFGAISCDVVLGGMSGGDAVHRRQVFATAYRYACILFLLLGLGIGFLTPAFWIFWLKTSAPLGWITGWLAVLLGVSSGLNRIIVYAAMSLGEGKNAAMWSIAEVIFCLGGTLLAQPVFGLGGTLLAGAAAVLCLGPVAWRISRAFEQSFWKTWFPRFTVPATT